MTTILAALEVLGYSDGIVLRGGEPEDAAAYAAQVHAPDGVKLPSWAEVAAKRDELAGVARVDAVKVEARRRILAHYPEWKQANLTARGVELVSIRVVAGTWTAEETAEVTQLQAAWDWIKAVRAASDALEAMNPVPDDIAADKYWPV